jgi:hypothetical protein
MDNQYSNKTLTALKEADDIRTFPKYYECYNIRKEIFEDIMHKAANDPGFIERCEEISKDFAQIDYLEENFTRKRED